MDGKLWRTSGLLSDAIPGTHVISLSEMVKEIKVQLGLPNKDIAKMLGVTQQSLHNYTSADDEIVVREETLERIRRLYDVITKIRSFIPHSPGAMAKNYRRNGKSLFDLLAADSIEDSEIMEFGEVLADKLSHVRGDQEQFHPQTLYQMTKHT